MLKKLLICPDTHAPYHDARAWRLMMKVARFLEPDVVIHMGDLADFYKLSSFSKDPQRGEGLDDEVRSVRELRADLDSLKPKRKVFIEGNHEDRLRRYLQDKAPALFSMLNTDKLLELSENDWEFVPYKDSIRIGKVFYTHDAGGGGGTKYSTARAAEAFHHSVVIGHHHSLSYLVNGNAAGEHLVAAQFGWLGDVAQADYMHRIKARRSWSLAFGVGHMQPNGITFLTPVPIINYSACLNGRVFKEAK